ncbi:formimidoylglutamase [Algicola sagamiensis]|uniref:formimidoylglutamase n=1 Tax=Algicola sagamiensis TaxID=163869 RepID=UPI00036BDDD6|nr:formimidoylglutamase [Algicola sagamiensis]
MEHVHIYQRDTILPWQIIREGETRIGQVFHFLPNNDTLAAQLQQAKQQGVQFVLFGIPEDIGPRANCGTRGADRGWEAFLKRFINQQSTQFFSGKDILLLGHLDVADLQEKANLLPPTSKDYLATLRELCSQLDERALPILTEVFKAGLEPIVIGGGHNNCYPIIKALYQAYGNHIGCINLDPHADYRALEGRHSGNGFHYANKDGYLSAYYVIGLHEQKNNQAIFDALSEKHFRFDSYQNLYIRREKSLSDSVFDAKTYLLEHAKQFGVEVDMDSISFMPVSAYNIGGITLGDAEHMVYESAQLRQSRYLHLCEGAPSQHPMGLSAGENDVGQGLSSLVCAYIQGRHLVEDM